MSKVLVPLAIGFEEIEAVTIIDVLRRAGIRVIVAAVSSEITVQGANGIIVKADTYLSDVDEESLDMIVLPGGWGGTDVLAVDETVQSIIKTMNKRNKLIGAICAAPFALDKAGVLPNKFTCYPSVEEKIDNDGYICDQSVVEQGNIITSRGPGTSICFALEIVKKLKGEEIYTELRSGLLAQFC